VETALWEALVVSVGPAVLVALADKADLAVAAGGAGLAKRVGLVLRALAEPEAVPVATGVPAELEGKAALAAARAVAVST
jgi:hypothetical protein